MMRSRLLAMLVGMCALLTACATAPSTYSGKQELVRKAERTVADFKAADPSLASMLNDSYGYAVFPTVAKGGYVVGGAYGRGVVYEQGRQVGYCDLSQGSFGLQIGGQSYRELILFEHKHALDRFKRNEFALAAQASAVAAASGSGANARYNHGVAVFTLGEKGLMVEAAVGGQRFEYQPM